jgi:hypothetical protein
MLFYNNNKVNKLILLRRKLYLMFLCLFKTTLINLAKYNIVLLCTLIINKRLRLLINFIKYTLKFS